ncbi:MAG: hypothetical protein WCK48_03570 [bacterium]
MKKIILTLVIIALLFGGIYYIKNKKKVAPDTTISRYSNASVGVSFTFPKILSASTTGSTVAIHHEIPYPNNGKCDMMGDTKTYNNLTDFNVTIKVVEKGLVDTVKEISPYIPQENFVNGELVASPGFIDPVTIGKWNGYSIYEGAEGCGQTTYYFPVSKSQTLVVQKESIQILSGVILNEVRQKVLAVPGVISLEKSEEIFKNLLETLKVN